MYDTPGERNSLSVDKTTIFYKLKGPKSTVQAIQCDSLEIEFEDKDHFYNEKHHFAGIIE